MEALPYSAVEPYEGIVHSVARRLAGAFTGDVEDLVQEGWLCLVNAIREGIDLEQDDVEARVMRWIRSEARRSERQQKGDSEVPFTYGGPRQRPAAQIDARDALASLPPELQTVILLRHHFGYLQIEVAARMGVDARTVRRWEDDASRKIRRYLETTPGLAHNGAIHAPSEPHDQA